MDNDEQEMENPGGGGIANGANRSNGSNESNGDYQDEQHIMKEEGDESDGEESHEEHGDEGDEERSELLTQPMLPPTAQPTLDALAQATASPIAHINNLLAIHPHLIAKFNMESSDPELIQNRSSFEALQAMMNSGSFNVPNMLFGMSSMYRSPQPSLQQVVQQQQTVQQQTVQQQQSNLQQQSLQSSNCSAANPGTSQAVVSCSTMQPESPKSNHEEANREGETRESRESRETRETRAGTGTNQQMPNWSFEEQFKQLYEIDNNPKRKIFLDELFAFMQNRGTAITRLPIMAKSVLDLFELYKLVVARGGLVEVINKKLWQEIIKGLHLPSSITSAAFTLRSQYMKYLYAYERITENLSTQEELSAAVESNRREGRRNSYVTFTSPSVNENMQSAMQRQQMQNQHAQNSLALHHSMSLAQMAAVAGPNGRPHTPLQHQPHSSQHAPSSLVPQDYMMKILSQDILPRNMMSADSSMLQRHPIPSTVSPSTAALPEALGKVDYRLGLWNSMCHNNHNNHNNNASNGKIYSTIAQSPLSSATHSPLAPANSPEPQREALDLASSTFRSEHGITSPIPSPSMSRSLKRTNSPSALCEKTFDEDEPLTIDENNHLRVNQSILVRDGGRKQLRMSVDINGVIYKGVLAASNENINAAASNSSSSENETALMDPVDNAQSSQNISS